MSDGPHHDAIREDDLTKLQIRALVAILASGVATVLALSGMSSAATAGSDQGVTDKSVKIGFIFSKTGVASATTATSDLGCKARVARENANGGVNGRKIQVEYFDDQSSGANLTGAQDLVQNRHVYMIVNNSAFAFLTYRWLLDNQIPVIGGGYDGTYYGTPGNEKVISGFGNQAPVTGVTTDLTAKIMKQLGATKVAALGYGISPSSSNAAKAFNQYAVPSVGLKAVYTNTTVDFGTTDVGPLVLGIKNAGADAAYYAMVANTNLAIVQGLKQNGVNMKANIMATGYGQQLLDQPVANQLGPTVVFTQGWKPIELKSKETKQFQADLKKYADFTGVPDFGIYTGYTDCDLAITGLKQQGHNLDRATYTDAIRNLKQVNPAGLGCQPLHFGLDTYGKPPRQNCQYAMYVKDGKFLLLKPKNSNKPFWTGELIGRSFTEATTTTATSAQ
jgi:ABC-type branched-subunit amino acid transport system substrate-binding protein